MVVEKILHDCPRNDYQPQWSNNGKQLFKNFPNVQVMKTIDMNILYQKRTCW